MSQQMQSQPSTAQQSSGQMGQAMQGAQQMGLRLQDVQTPQEQQMITDIGQAMQICGWCADQCIQEADPMMVECIDLCQDVVELGESALALLALDSRYAQSVLQTFSQAAQACAQECGQHQHAHCQDCAQVLPQTTQSIQQYLGTVNQ